MKHLAFQIVLLLFITTACFAKEPVRSFECMVERVLDGDTVSCGLKSSGGTYVKIRLYGVDAPEIEHRNKKTGLVSKKGQPFGSEAMDALHSKVYGSVINVDVINVDRYKRLVGVLNIGNRNINREMVSEGWSWAYRQYLDRPHASEYITAEEQARSKKLALWKQSNPQPPWEFRKLQKKGSK